MSKRDKLSTLEKIFTKAGFTHIDSDSTHFTIGGQKGEIDHIFIWENLAVLCEETSGNNVSHHHPKKALFHNNIKSDPNTFFKVFCEKKPELEEVIFNNEYEYSDMEIRFIYYATADNVPDGVIQNPDPFFILNKNEAIYFETLVDSIEGAAKYDLLRYLEVRLQDIGEARRSGSGVKTKSFPGIAIPTKHTHYPDEFLIVSFYADPASLIRRAFVSRRNGWQERDLSYQRFIDRKKIRSMRERLSHEKEVYINNLIVTLSSNVDVRDEKKDIVNSKSLSKTKSVYVGIPEELGTVVIIDGQHRLFSYFDSTVKNTKKLKEIDEKISSLRGRQNLLVTGIIFPKGYQGNKEAFEAKLFLDINKNQKKVSTSLQQDLEVIINPNSDISIARRVVHELSSAGALDNKLRISQSDDTDLIDSGSLSKHILCALLKKNSSISKEWSEQTKKERGGDNDKDFISYVSGDLRLFLGAVAEILKNKWATPKQGGVLSTIVVGGFIHLWNMFVLDYHKSERDYQSLLKNYKINNVDFSKYTSSRWRIMAHDIYGPKRNKKD